MDGAWTAAAVRRAEAQLMSRLPPGTLMQRAAAGLATECARLLQKQRKRRNPGGVYGSTVVVLAGPGDNGGDALYAGARLARRGARVFAVPVMGDRVHPLAAAALTRAGGRLVSHPPAHCDLLLDGVLGIGGRPGLPARALDQLSRIEADTTVAVDVPSGVDVDTGAVPDSAVTADVTVAFGCRKPCHVLGRAALLTGRLVLVDIGLGPSLDPHPAVRVASGTDIATWWHRPEADDDKYTRGVIGVAAGSERYPGAAVLAVNGALAGPSGYVRYAGAAAEYVRRSRPEVVCTPTVKEAGRVQAWLAGPGFGTDEAALAQLVEVLAAPAPAVLDADALTLIGEYPSVLARREAPVVLTPHDREYERLYGSPPSEDRAGAAAALAKRLNCTVLLKGHHTVVASSDGTVWANPTGRPQLATAGSGDVLAGFMGSLLASGMDEVKAAVAAAFLHGKAAGIAAEGHRTMTASDLARALPQAVGEMLSH
ncbi:bifunctional ADP-dependent NAD(P)H-hydrate dehydratase/NAD(P)H-hydrate epimerase [Glycomyces sp. NRRL B-16210]|uniref:bifunctional ADP-dependent NAD(P)H-hydrate dehydratase/NAD(P)H-hydrate epimerase n=1 Tax=Glycomyces sp. NRRL B-16210 TaxID=1463821 RepID=UPI0004BFB0EC|nr:bifunctional ADP-dependent NAD(P)H-hydrate dehydratase/NAD(P)H-hydrate epimerase [Glycomyces sp. NRRL B-16210]